MKKSEDFTVEQFLLIVGILLFGSFIFLTVVTPMLFEATHKQMVKTELEAAEHQAAIAERERVAANSASYYLRGK